MIWQIAKDEAGVDRLKERVDGKKLTPAEKQAAKKAAFAAKQAEEKGNLFPSVSLPSLPF